MPENQAEILELCMQGDRQAQRIFYEHFKDKMFVVALRYAHTREDAEDILQDGFVKIFRDLPHLRKVESLEAWMRRILVNAALQFLKKQKARFQSTDLDNWSEGAKTESSVFEEEENRAKGLLKLMAKMPVGFRTVLNLYVMEGYSHEEIADMLEISVGTSKSQLSRAKAYLRSLVEQNLIE